MATILPIIQIVISVILVILVLLQNKSAGIGALGGSESETSSFGTRRGFEKMLFEATVFVAVIFVLVSIISFIVA